MLHKILDAAEMEDLFSDALTGAKQEKHIVEQRQLSTDDDDVDFDSGIPLDLAWTLIRPIVEGAIEPVVHRLGFLGRILKGAFNEILDAVDSII